MQSHSLIKCACFKIIVIGLQLMMDSFLCIHATGGLMCPLCNITGHTCQSFNEWPYLNVSTHFLCCPSMALLTVIQAVMIRDEKGNCT